VSISIIGVVIKIPAMNPASASFMFSRGVSVFGGVFVNVVVIS